ncbi:MAG: hypothetical protein AABY44_08955 [Nitrospirota bacterium]
MKLFGRYLLEKGKITRIDIIRARELQRMHNKSFFEIVLEKGFMKKEDIARVQTIQEETNKPFEDIAVHEGIITSLMRDKIIDEMERNHMYFGEALVINGAISKEELIKELKEFNLMVIKEQMKEGR